MSGRPEKRKMISLVGTDATGGRQIRGNFWWWKTTARAAGWRENCLGPKIGAMPNILSSRPAPFLRPAHSTGVFGHRSKCYSSTRSFQHRSYQGPAYGSRCTLTVGANMKCIMFSSYLLWVLINVTQFIGAYFCHINQNVTLSSLTGRVPLSGMVSTKLEICKEYWLT